MTKSTSSQRTTITLPGVSAPETPSIRQIMLRGILQGTPKAEIQAEVAKHHAGAAGDVKFSKHLAWYKAWIKKNPTDKSVVALTPVPATAE